MDFLEVSHGPKGKSLPGGKRYKIHELNHHFPVRKLFTFTRPGMGELLVLSMARDIHGIMGSPPGDICREEDFQLRVQHALLGALLGDSFAWNRGAR